MNELLAILERKVPPDLYYTHDSIPLTQLRQLCQAHHFTLYYLDGEHIHNKAEFLENCAEVLNFPDYFGYNWDAFEDCLTDLSPSSDAPYLLFYAQPQNFVQNAPQDWQIALDILQDALNFLHNQGKVFYAMVEN